MSKKKKEKQQEDFAPLSEGLPAEFVNTLALILQSSKGALLDEGGLALSELPTRAEQKFSLSSVLKNFGLIRPVYFRLNPILSSSEEVEAICQSLELEAVAEKVLEGVWSISPEKKSVLSHSHLCTQGKVYIQGLSSQLAVPLLELEPKMEAMDLAAAPGGKTLQMAAALKGEGFLSAVEAVRNRFFVLKQNLKTAGVGDFVRTYLQDGRLVGAKCESRFDRVLLDAPCSSEARFEKDNRESFQNWSPKKVKECQRRQKGLLISAFKSLKSGGKMLYCTCTLSPEENELSVQYLLDKVKGQAQVLPISLPLISGLGPALAGLESWKGLELSAQLRHSLRLLPSEKNTAFYLCLIQKN